MFTPPPVPQPPGRTPPLRSWRVYLKPRTKGGSPEIATVEAEKCEAVGNLGVVFSIGDNVLAHYPFGSYTLVVQFDPETGEEFHIIDTDDTAEEEAPSAAPSEHKSGELKPVAALRSVMPADGSWIDRTELFRKFHELTGANYKKFNSTMWAAGRHGIEYDARSGKARLRPKA